MYAPHTNPPMDVDWNLSLYLCNSWQVIHVHVSADDATSNLIFFCSASKPTSALCQRDFMQCTWALPAITWWQAHTLINMYNNNCVNMLKLLWCCTPIKQIGTLVHDLFQLVHVFNELNSNNESVAPHSPLNRLSSAFPRTHKFSCRILRDV